MGFSLCFEALELSEASLKLCQTASKETLVEGTLVEEIMGVGKRGGDNPP